MAASLDEKDDLLKNDYYALLNVDRKASIDEINNSFRHLSKIYHPDKHVDQVKKRKAEDVFNKLRKAHDVLRDPTRRTIYDMYGEKGLETEDMEVIARTKTPSEIITEYERIQTEKEERRLQKMTNPRGTISVTLNATEIFDVKSEVKVTENRPGRSVEISSMSIGQSVECPLTDKDTMVVVGNLETRNAVGQGTLSLMWRRIVSVKGWVEAELQIGSASAVGFTSFRHLTESCYLRCELRGEIAQYGYRPLANIMIAYQFDTNLQGRLTYSLSQPSSVVTNIVYSSDQDHVTSRVQLGSRSSYFSLSYTRTILNLNAKIRGAFRVGTLGGMVECSVEKKVTDFSHVGGTLLIGVPQGVHLKIKLLRGQQIFFFPIHLSEGMNPSAVMYGALLPFACYYVIRKLIINPIVEQLSRREREKNKEEYADNMEQRKIEAVNTVKLMAVSYERYVEQEERRFGLVIIKALYGKFQVSDDGQIVEQICIDVTVPVQALVIDSKLVLPETSSKSGLPGFYDPCIDEEKELYIRYKFKGNIHQVTISNTDHVRIPQQNEMQEVCDSQKSAIAIRGYKRRALWDYLFLGVGKCILHHFPGYGSITRPSPSHTMDVT